MMCAATHFPKAVLLCSLKACAIVQALSIFFSTFSFLRHIHSDQGSHFMFKILAQVMSELKVKHHTASTYHSESQGGLERFHQALTGMLHKFCKPCMGWGFVVRETVQESLGFSPADLALATPLVCWEKSCSQKNSVSVKTSWNTSVHSEKDCITAGQTKMKTNYDQKSVAQTFQEGDHVLVFLPVVGSAL